MDAVAIRARVAETNVCPQGKAAGQASNVSPLAQHSFYATRSDAGTLLNFAVDSFGEGGCPQGEVMFSRSFRLFNVRFFYGFAMAKTRRYYMFFHTLADGSESQMEANVCGNSLRQMLKALPEVARELSMLFGDDIRVVIKDMDNDGEEIFSQIGFYVPIRIVSDATVSLSEVIKLK